MKKETQKNEESTVCDLMAIKKVIYKSAKKSAGKWAHGNAGARFESGLNRRHCVGCGFNWVVITDSSVSWF